MTHRTMRNVLRAFGVTATLWLAACGDDNGPPPPPTNTSTATVTQTTAPTATRTPTTAATATPVGSPTNTPVPHPTPSRTPTPTPVVSVTPMQSLVTGLVVVNRTVTSGPGDILGAPPPEWSGDPTKASFDRSLAYADWAVTDANKEGVTGPDGRFSLTGLSPGRYSFQVTKTLDGDLATLSFPFTVGDNGSADVVAEVSWGLVRSVSTYTRTSVPLEEIRGPYGTWLITQDGRVREIGDTSRSFVDTDGDGRFDIAPCAEQVWECGTDRSCGNDRVCSACTASCPSCDNCGPGVCVPSVSVLPYLCGTNDTCALAGDHCVCVSSCPDCTDCSRKVCVPDCEPVDITAVEIENGPTQLVVGQQGSISAVARLSDGSTINVTYLATWHSSNDAVATVDSWGQVIARSVGTAALTATVGTLTSAPWSVDVVARPTLQRIHVQNESCYYPLGVPTDFGSKPPVEAPPSSGILPPIPTCGQVVQIGRTIQFRAVGEFANGYYQDITDEVQWQVAPADVGDVVGGLFTALQAGTTTLTASLGSVVSDATEIRVVTAPTVTALSIYADTGIIAFADGGPQRVDVAIPCPIVSAGALCCCPGPLADAVNPCDCGYSITVLRGDQVKFRATAQYDTGDFRDVTDEVMWRSSNAAAATIDVHGVMTAVEAGDATIDAVLDSVGSNTVGAHVVNEATLQSLYIYQEGTDRVVAKGDQRFFKATGNYDIGFGRDVTATATWRSTDDRIGGFDTAGVFTARAAGTTQVWAELDGKQSDRLSLEVYETSDITYCDPAHVNRAVWSDNFNLVTLESTCGEYRQPDVVGLRYTVTELQPRGGVFDPCLDLYVYEGGTRIRTIREEGCGDPFLPSAAPGRDEEVLKYQLRAFWDLKDDAGQPVPPGTYTIYGRFYLYYDPVVSIDVDILSPDGTPRPTRTRTPTPIPPPVCTPPSCPPGGRYVCPNTCPGGCGVVCLPPDQVVSLEVGSAVGGLGETVPVSVSLRSFGQAVAKIQNDLLFDAAVPIAAQADGRPDCAVASSTDASAAQFRFIPDGCQPGADCTGVQATVGGLESSTLVPDAIVVYTCNVIVQTWAVVGANYGLGIGAATASNATGGGFLVVGQRGAITIGGTPGDPTPTPTFGGVCDAPMCEPDEVLICAHDCSNGCGYVCVTPTPTPVVVCTPPSCSEGQVPICPGSCPGGCGFVCGTPVPTPTPEGFCFRGAPACTGTLEPTSRSACCTLSRLSASPLSFSWCATSAFDPTNGQCSACAADPCGGEPPPPTPLRSVTEIGVSAPSSPQ